MKWVRLSRDVPDPQGEREQSGTCGWGVQGIPKGDQHCPPLLHTLQQLLHILEDEFWRIKGEFPSYTSLGWNPPKPAAMKWDQTGMGNLELTNSGHLKTWGQQPLGWFGTENSSHPEIPLGQRKQLPPRNSPGTELKVRAVSGRKSARSFGDAVAPKGGRNSSLWEPLERCSRTYTALSHCFHAGGVSKIYLPNWRNLKGNLEKINL